MTALTLTINGRRVEAFVEPRTHLADFLREQQRLTGTHLGCEHGVCGACTVLLDDQPIRSCITYAVACEGRDVRTIESFEQDLVMGELREAFSRSHGLQCGFCTPGMLITARDICARKPGADENEIRIELSGNLCRCTGYVGIVDAVKSVIAAHASSAPAPTQTPAARRAAIQPFAPMQTGASSDTPPVPALEKGAVASRKGNGGMQIEESIEVNAPAREVWKALSDIPTAASCLPGAEIIDYDADSVKGSVRVKFGPMRAAFNGAASITRIDGTMSGSVHGAGIDSLSKTRARGELSYRVVPVDQGAAARIEVNLSYALVGPLAQFSRSGLVKDFAHRLMIEFARNLKDRLTRPEEPLRKAELRAGVLLFAIMWERLKRLFFA